MSNEPPHAPASAAAAAAVHDMRGDAAALDSDIDSDAQGMPTLSVVEVRDSSCSDESYWSADEQMSHASSLSSPLPSCTLPLYSASGRALASRQHSGCVADNDHDNDDDDVASSSETHSKVDATVQPVMLHGRNSLDAEFCIKDLDTGRAYALEAVMGPTSSQDLRVRDMSTGEALDIRDFNTKLGLTAADVPPLPPRVTDKRQAAQKQKGMRKILQNMLTPRRLMSSQQLPPQLPLSTPYAAVLRGNAEPQAQLASQYNNAAAQQDAESSQLPSSTAQHGTAASTVYGAALKVMNNGKAVKDFSGIRLVQTVAAHHGEVWTVQRSPDGRFLASGGKDGLVRVWQFCTPTPLEQTSPASQNGSNGGAHVTPRAHSHNQSAAVALSRISSDGDGAARVATSAASAPDMPANGGLQPANDFSRRDVIVPYREYRGHTADITSLAWSCGSQFLLSASVDKSVKLWHIDLDQPLRNFAHSDFVTAVSFHPRNDKYFASTTIDGMVRLWCIPEIKVVEYDNLREMMTAVSFTSDGRKLIVGTSKGRCRFYNISAQYKIQYAAQIDVRNAQGKHSKGKKITGFSHLPREPSKVLITTGDSRIRLYDGLAQTVKYKGHRNTNSSMISASFSNDGSFIISGSDDGCVYVWSTASFAATADDNVAGVQKQYKVGSYECFRAFADESCTAAIFAPKSCWRNLPRPSQVAAVSKAAAATLRGSNVLATLSGGGKAVDDEQQRLEAAARAHVAAAESLGAVIIAAGAGGELRVFENTAAPDWV